MTRPFIDRKEKWKEHAAAVETLGREATVDQVATFLHESSETARTYLESAWHRGRLTRRMAIDGFSRHYVYESVGGAPTQEGA